MATVAGLKKELKTIDVKGKPYVEVHERVKYFRQNYSNWCIETEILSLAEGICVIKATVRDENGVIKSSGIAYEKEGTTFINKTSYIENCETSAVGRALGFLGIGIDAGIASKEEVETAQLNQFTKQDLVCPKCGKKITKLALDNWGMCAECKRKFAG